MLLNLLKKLPQTTKSKTPVSKEGRLTLLTSKLQETTELTDSRESHKWSRYACLNLTVGSLRNYLFIFSMPLGACLITAAVRESGTFGLITLLHPTFIFSVLTMTLVLIAISFIASFYCSLLAMMAMSNTNMSQNPFPTSAYLLKSGFAFWDRKNLVPWENVRAVKLRELLFSGSMRTNVLELYIKEPPSKLKDRILRLLKIDGMKKPLYFLDPATQKPVKDEYEGVCLRLPLACFGFENEKQKFLTAIKEHVHPDAFDGEFAAESSSGDVESFTQLWLSDLRTSNSSNITRTLANGHELKEGTYVVDGILGYGGFSVVYSAHAAKSETGERATTQTRVAVKEIVLNSGGTRTSKEAILKHIVSEVDLLRNLDHPNIVRCLDFFTEGGKVYVVLEAFAGKNLRDYVEQFGPFNEDQLAEVAFQCCSILTYLHTRPKPVIHRDFTPDNLIKVDDVIKLIDFNVAEEANASSSHTIVGKHAYLAPEQWCGQFTTSGDLYQLGCTLYFLATGKDSEPLTQSILKNPNISPELTAIVQKLTAHAEEQRFANAEQLNQTLHQIYSSRRVGVGN